MNTKVTLSALAFAVAIPFAALAADEFNPGLDLQKDLLEAGFDPGPLDGQPGPGTWLAFASWFKNNYPGEDVPERNQASIGYWAGVLGGLDPEGMLDEHTALCDVDPTQVVSTWIGHWGDLGEGTLFILDEGRVANANVDQGKLSCYTHQLEKGAEFEVMGDYAIYTFYNSKGGQKTVAFQGFFHQVELGVYAGID